MSIPDALAILDAIPGWAEFTALALILAVGIIIATIAMEALRRARELAAP